MSQNDKISETAIIVASLRALSNHEEELEFRCNDSYAELFLPDERRIPLKDKQAREMIKKAVPKGMLEYVISRTRYFDDLFIQALNEEIPQIVVLGAGFDSRPYRFKSLIKGTTIFEVDAKPTQEYKKAHLKGIPDLTKNVIYISADIESSEVFEKLGKSGFKHSERTLFILEGVTFYLTDRAVNGLMHDVRELSAQGSMIGFDFMTKKNTDELVKTNIKEEPVIFGIEENMINEFVLSNDYHLEQHLGSEEIEQKFMLKNNGELFGEISPMMNFILLRV